MMAQEKLCYLEKFIACRNSVNFRGFFQRGDTIQVLSKNFKNIAIGVSAYSSEDISQIKGLKSEQIKNVLGYSSRGEVIHTNNMVISENE